MLMEHSAETSHDTENAKKSRSLDLQRLYKTKQWASPGKKGGSYSGSRSRNALKRKLGSEDQNGGRKKSKKEVLLSSLASGEKSKKSAGEVSRAQASSLSSEPGKSESGVDHRDNVGGGFGGISLNLNTNVNIPKRPRDLVRRKKVEVDVGSKQEGTSSSKATLVEGGGQLNGNSNGNLSHNGNVNGKPVQNGESEGTSTGSALAKVKRKNRTYDHKENRSKGSDFPRRLKGDDSRSSVHNGNSLTKKARRNHKKTKKAGAASPVVTKESKLVLDESSRICDDSQDDEENLEANAARMLSSRFDPSCTGFSGGKSSKLPSTNGLSTFISSSSEFAAAQPGTRGESDIASSDAEERVLRPRDQQKGKGLTRKRRHFYEVLLRELDSYWVLNRRIKVFWPLDQSWYIGHVIDYDAEKKLHHIKYDDRDEEWIDLQHERFKLLLLPSEAPGRVGRKKSRVHDDHTRKVKHGEATDTDGLINSCIESEPIISWLARSSRRKSPPFGARKKQRTHNGSGTSRPSSFSEGKIDPRGSLEVGSSGGNADDVVCSSELPENSGDSTRHGKSLTKNFISDNNRSPIVYFRRRFHRKEQPASDIHSEELCQLSGKTPIFGTLPESIDSLYVDADMLQSMEICGHSAKRSSPDELIWSTDNSGLLKLSISATSLKFLRFELSFPLPVVLNKLIGWQSSIFMLRQGTMISAWPMVHLEMLFVDNIVGLRFLLFEGCLMQAVIFVFLVMTVFCQSNQKEAHFDQQLPVTSVRVRLSGLQDFRKQLVFTFYNFTEIANSKWSYLDRKLKRHCLLTKQLPPSECTYDNIKALRNSCNPSSLTCVSRQHSSVSLRKRSRQQKINISSRQSAYLKLSGRSWDSDLKQGKLPPFALSFAAAPTFFLSLHLKLLMERSISSSSFGEQDPLSLMDHSENDSGLVGVNRILVEDIAVRSSLSLGGNLGVLQGGRNELEALPNLPHEISAFSEDSADGTSTNPSHGSQDFPGKKVDVDLQLKEDKARVTGLERGVLSAQTLDTNDQVSPVLASVGCGPPSGMAIEIPSCDPIEKDADNGVRKSHHPVNLALDITDSVARSPNHTAPRGIWIQNRVGSSSSSPATNLSPTWYDGKQDFLRSGLGNGPKKPRTQVSYSLPFGGHDSNSKNKFHPGRGFSHKRIRRASEKKTSEALGTSPRNMDFSCDANVLVTVGDRGWRVCGARVVLDLIDHNEWRLTVKISGDTKYSYKAHQFLQPGTTNRFTHAMMWKGGKDWILEFPDRSQWATFKEMHEECYNRNFRAASVKNIPIPGVRLVEENDDNVPEVPFVRPSPKYYRQVETDVDIAMDSSRVLYDMDSDDERWLAKYRGLESNKSGYADISDEMFEKTMDVFEKVAYAKQCDHFSSDELEEDMSGLGPLETIKIIYEHWREKRQKKGMPLIRHLQPPLWEKYQQQVKEWELAIVKCNAALSNGCQEKPMTIEKPPMFAFCMKPRGLELPNRGSKHRSQKKLPIGALSNVSADSDAFHSLVSRRLNGCALGDERVVYTAYNQGTSDSSPVLQGSTRVFSPRDAGGLGYFQLSSDVSERNHYPKLYRNKSKKLCFIPPSSDHQAFASSNQRIVGKRAAVHGWNTSSSEWPSQMHYLPDGFQKHSFEQLDPSELDEFRLRDAASAARHAVTIAKMKREKAQRMLCRADLAMHKAVAAIMNAEAIDASYKEPNSDA